MKPFRAFMKKPFVVVFMGSLLVFLGLEGVRESGGFEFLELGTYDWFMRLEPKPGLPDPRITLIDISEQDLQTIGRWPLTDEVLVKALHFLLKESPRAVGLDIYRDIPVPPGREELNQVFSQNPNLIGIMTVGENGVPPLPVIRDTEQAAFNDIVVDPGGIVRRALLFMDDGQNVYTSFALRLATLYLEREGIFLQSDPDNPAQVRLKDVTIKPFEANDGGYIRADSRGYQFLLDNRSAVSPFRSYPLTRLLAGDLPAEAIFDRIILIGVSAHSVKDYFYTPLSRGFLENQQVSGIVLHGQILSQLLRFALDGTLPISTLKGVPRLAWVFCWAVLGGTIGLRMRSARRFSLWISGGLILLFSTAFYLFFSRLWIPVVPPAFSFFISAVGVVVYRTGQEKRERTMLMQIFSRHVSKEVAEMIWEQREQFLDNGRPRSQNLTVTVFFSDLKNFTAISEKLSPEDLINWLNTYMEPMARLIMAHGGVIDGFAGDGIKADFGVPLPRNGEKEVRRDAMNAVACALAMEKEMHLLNALWREKGLPAVGIRIGIYTGPVVGGLLGSSQRLKYTTIGDTVNIASRLESFEKEVARDALCRILIGESTLRYLDGHFETERIGDVDLKGKDERITIHRVLGVQPSRSHCISQEVTQCIP